MNTGFVALEDSDEIFMDFQPRMVFGVADIDRQTLFSSVLLRMRAACCTVHRRAGILLATGKNHA